MRTGLDERSEVGTVGGGDRSAGRREAGGWRLATQVGAGVSGLLVLVQAALAGQVIGGRDGMVGIHETGSHALFTLSLALAVITVVGWRRGQLPAWLGLGGPVLWTLVTVQAFAGYARVFALHVPLGVTLFGASLLLLFGASTVRR